MESVAVLSESLGIQLKLEKLDCEPFYHCFGDKCVDGNLVFARWMLPIKDLNGNDCNIPFYIVKGNGPILLGNSVLGESNLLGSENLLVVPPKVGNLSNKELVFPVFKTYQDSVPIRTFLHVVPSQTKELETFLSSIRTFASTMKSTDFTQGKQAQEFATRFHLYTHLHPNDMDIICTRAGILTSVLKQALCKAYNKCTSCKTTGKPKSSRKVSFSRLISSFNHRLQIDYFYIKELGRNPILHICDSHTSFSVAVQVESRDQELACKMIRTHWFDVYGPPTEIIGDPEFENDYIRQMLKIHGVNLLPCPARRHNKIGIVESNHRCIRLFVERLFKDAARNHSVHGVKISLEEILSRSVFLKNIIHGDKKLSSFEQAKGYSPALRGIPQCLLSKETVKAHYEQVARRSIARFLSSMNPSTIPHTLLQPKTPIYYFVRRTNNKGGTWNLGFVKKCQEQLVMVTNSSSGRGIPRRIALEDVRLAPSTSLLYELDTLDSSEISVQKNTTVIADEQSTQVHDIAHFANEYLHSVRCSTTFLGNQPSSLGENIAKDVGDTSVPNSLSEADFNELKSMEQQLLRSGYDVLGSANMSRREVEFLPNWMIERSINKEKEGYQDVYQQLKREDVPRGANVITSHAFFQIKPAADKDTLRLKCRLVPHGNRDKEKESLRSDCATAQFPIIRLLVAMAAIFKFRLGCIDITGAFLQNPPIERDIYVQPPRGWSDPGMLWKLLKPAYGLVESGRMWQLLIDQWLNNQKFEQIPGLPQLFVLRDSGGSVHMLIAKVVDDFLVASSRNQLEQFNNAISKAFKVGKFCTDDSFLFNGCNITQSSTGITMSMESYLSSVESIDVARSRRKEKDSLCTDAERKLFLRLTGRLNFLGHATLPQAAFVASYLQQSVGSLHVSDLSTANSCLYELRKLTPTLSFPISTTASKPEYIAFSDASMGRHTYGQTGYISGISFLESSRRLFYTIDWHSGKQSRVCFSSLGAEILAAAESADRSSLVVQGIHSICNAEKTLSLRLATDSMGLWSTISTLHEGKDYRLRPVVSRLRDCYEGGEIHIMMWIPGTCNIADALTKRNLSSYQILNEVLINGYLKEELLQTVHEISASNK